MLQIHDRSIVYNGKNLQYKFLNWKWHPPHGFFPKIHPFWKGHPSLWAAGRQMLNQQNIWIVWYWSSGHLDDSWMIQPRYILYEHISLISKTNCDIRIVLWWLWWRTKWWCSLTNSESVLLLPRYYVKISLKASMHWIANVFPGLKLSCHKSRGVSRLLLPNMPKLNLHRATTISAMECCQIQMAIPTSPPRVGAVGTQCIWPPWRKLLFGFD